MTSDLITSLPVVGLGGLLVILVRLTHHLRANYMEGGKKVKRKEKMRSKKVRKTTRGIVKSHHDVVSSPEGIGVDLDGVEVGVRVRPLRLGEEEEEQVKEEEEQVKEEEEQGKSPEEEEQEEEKEQEEHKGEEEEQDE